MRKTFAVIASISTLLGTSAFAADMPVKAPVYKAPPAAAASGNWYFWLDGMYENVRLPTYSLGLHNDAGFAAGDRDLGTVQTFTPRLDGGGVRGALGYMIPGTGARVEIGGSYIASRGTTSQNTTPTLPTNFVSVQL